MLNCRPVSTPWISVTQTQPSSECVASVTFITTNTHLLRGALELLEPVLQAVHGREQVAVLRPQHVLVKLDLLEEALGRRVVVATLVLQVRDAHGVDGLVDAGHELRHRVAHVGLQGEEYCVLIGNLDQPKPDILQRSSNSLRQGTHKLVVHHRDSPSAAQRLPGTSC